MAHISSGESSKPESPQKGFLMGELAMAKRSLAQKDEEIVGFNSAKVQEGG